MIYPFLAPFTHFFRTCLARVSLYIARHVRNMCENYLLHIHLIWNYSRYHLYLFSQYCRECKMMKDLKNFLNVSWKTKNNSANNYFLPNFITIPIIKTNIAKTTKIPKPIPTLNIPVITLHELITNVSKIKTNPLISFEFFILIGLKRD